jgi:hypothetical protein
MELDPRDMVSPSRVRHKSNGTGIESSSHSWINFQIDPLVIDPGVIGINSLQDRIP